MTAYSLIHNSFTCTAQEAEAYKRAEKEHGENIAVRMNPHTFRIEYYNKITGEIVSSHI